MLRPILGMTVMLLALNAHAVNCQKNPTHTLCQPSSSAPSGMPVVKDANGKVLGRAFQINYPDSVQVRMEYNDGSRIYGYAVKVARDYISSNTAVGLKKYWDNSQCSGAPLGLTESYNWVERRANSFEPYFGGSGLVDFVTVEWNAVIQKNEITGLYVGRLEPPVQIQPDTRYVLSQGNCILIRNNMFYSTNIIEAYDIGAQFSPPFTLERD